MSAKDLKYEAQKPTASNCDGDVWWYETTKGVVIFFDRPGHRSARPGQVLISWAKIRSAVERRDR